jgi:hypothetical protein
MVKVRYLVGILAILSIAAMACTPGGDKTTVTVAQGVAYYESTDGNLYAVDTNTGLKKWSFDTKGGLTSEPVVSGGVVYFGGKDGSLFAVDAATGTQKWAFKEKKASARKEVKVEQAEQTVSEKAKVEFFVMSQCPFGTQVETGIAPVLKKIGGDVDFTLDFIGGVQGDQLTSLHKEAEVQGDIVQICAIKYAPENYRYMDMIECMNKNYRAIRPACLSTRSASATREARARDCSKPLSARPRPSGPRAAPPCTLEAKCTAAAGPSRPSPGPSATPTRRISPSSAQTFPRRWRFLSPSLATPVARTAAPT